jgi:hypothetical protein
MKKAIYVFCAMILGLLLSFLLHLALVLKFMPLVGTSCPIGNAPPSLSILCYFPLPTLYSMVVLGLVVGFVLGQTWWRIVYIEKRHWSMRTKK